MTRRAPQTQGPRAQPLEPRERHAREDEEQQQVHQKVEEGLVVEVRGEIAEEDVALEGHVAQSEVGHRLDPPRGDQQEPAEREAHVHVAQQGIDTEDAAVEQRLAHNLAHGPQGAARRHAAHEAHAVRGREVREPRTPLPEQQHEHRRSADDERNTERSVESHG